MLPRGGWPGYGPPPILSPGACASPQGLRRQAHLVGSPRGFVPSVPLGVNYSHSLPSVSFSATLSGSQLFLPHRLLEGLNELIMVAKQLALSGHLGRSLVTAFAFLYTIQNLAMVCHMCRPSAERAMFHLLRKLMENPIAGATYRGLSH